MQYIIGRTENSTIQRRFCYFETPGGMLCPCFLRTRGWRLTGVLHSSVRACTLFSPPFSLFKRIPSPYQVSVCKLPLLKIPSLTLQITHSQCLIYWGSLCDDHSIVSCDDHVTSPAVCREGSKRQDRLWHHDIC